MLSEEQVEKIKRLRRLCYTWQEISNTMELPMTSCRYAITPRESKKDRRIRELRQKLRMKRRHIEYLEQKLRQHGIQPPNRQLINEPAAK